MLKDSWDGESDPLAALREGRRGPFEAFVRAETRSFLGFFARLGASRSEAEDLVQETFLKLFRLAAKTQNTPQEATPALYDARGRFAAYSFRVARNVWIDRSRKRASDPRTAGEEASALSISRDERREMMTGGTDTRPDARLQQLEESARIKEAVAALPESHRAVFELGVLQELPYAAIALALEIPIGTVKSRMFNAIKKVRDGLLESDRVRAAIRTRSSPSSEPAGLESDIRPSRSKAGDPKRNPGKAS